MFANNTGRHMKVPSCTQNPQSTVTRWRWNIHTDGIHHVALHHENIPMPNTDCMPQTGRLCVCVCVFLVVRVIANVLR
jgi:hypothetical protein